MVSDAYIIMVLKSSTKRGRRVKYLVKVAAYATLSCSVFATIIQAPVLKQFKHFLSFVCVLPVSFFRVRGNGFFYL